VSLEYIMQAVTLIVVIVLTFVFMALWTRFRKNGKRNR